MTEALARLADFMLLRYAFAVDATVACMAVGVFCGIVGAFVTLRGESLVGDAAAHATLPGVCAAFLLTGSRAPLGLLLGGLASAGLALLAIAGATARGRTRPDAAVAVATSVSFGAGAVLLTLAQRSPTGAQAGLQSLLFGSAAALTGEQLTQLGVLGGAATVVVLALARPLAAATFDEGWARGAGLRVDALHALLLACVCVVVVVSVYAVGAALASAMVVVPAVAARQWTNDFSRYAALAAAFGALSGWVGAGASFAVSGLPTGPAMVLAAFGVMVASIAFGGAARSARAAGTRVGARGRA